MEWDEGNDKGEGERERVISEREREGRAAIEEGVEGSGRCRDQG